MASEKQLIDANDVYALFGRSGTASLHVGDIDVIPRVDAVEVVRCKDCRARNSGIVRKEGRCLCERLSRWVWPDDFCSQGEREVKH